MWGGGGGIDPQLPIGGLIRVPLLLLLLPINGGVDLGLICSIILPGTDGDTRCVGRAIGP
jgi:hypothetical protein